MRIFEIVDRCHNSKLISQIRLVELSLCFCGEGNNQSRGRFLFARKHYQTSRSNESSDHNAFNYTSNKVPLSVFIIIIIVVVVIFSFLSFFSFFSFFSSSSYSYSSSSSSSSSSPAFSSSCYRLSIYTR